MKVLVAGTGSIGRRHIENIRRLEPKTQFLILRADRRHDELVDELDAKVVADIDEGTLERPDLVVIATPSALHTKLVTGCICNGIPFYVEKPVVITEGDIRLIREKIKRYGFQAPTQVGCNLRFLPSIRKAKQLIDDGALGNIARASFQAGQWLPDWRPQQDCKTSYSTDPTFGGGVVFDLIHEIDAARMLLGDFERVNAMTTVFQPLGIKSEAVATIILAKRDGPPLVSVGLDYVSRTPLRRYEIIGDRATLVWDLPSRRLTLQNDQRMTVISEKASDFDVARTYIDAMSELITAINEGTVTSQTINEGLKSSKLAIIAKGKA